jgi:hypothetical protein
MPRAAVARMKRARQHQRHGGERPCLPDGSHRAVEAGNSPSFTSGKPMRVASSRVAMRQWHARASSRPPAEAEAVDAAHHRDRQPLEAVEVAVDLRDAVGHLALVGELLELAHVGTDMNPLLLA